MQGTELRITLPEDAPPGTLIAIPVQGEDPVQLRVPPGVGPGSELVLVRVEGAEEWDVQIVNFVAAVDGYTEEQQIQDAQSYPQEVLPEAGEFREETGFSVMSDQQAAFWQAYSNNPGENQAEMFMQGQQQLGSQAEMFMQVEQQLAPQVDGHQRQPEVEPGQQITAHERSRQAYDGQRRALEEATIQQTELQRDEQWKADIQRTEIPTDVDSYKEAEPMAVAQTVRLETTVGIIDLILRSDWAPHGARRCLELVAAGELTDVSFYRAVHGCIAQFGLPSKRQWDPIPDDPPSGVPFLMGAVSFAAVGANSRKSTLLICLGDMTHCLGQNSWETPIGAVAESSLDVINNIFTAYGDLAEFGGQGPDTTLIRNEGNAYLHREFPQLTFIRRAWALDWDLDNAQDGNAENMPPMPPLNRDVDQVQPEMKEEDYGKIAAKAAQAAQEAAMVAASLAATAVTAEQAEAVTEAARNAAAAAQEAQAAAATAAAVNAATKPAVAAAAPAPTPAITTPAVAARSPATGIQSRPPASVAQSVPVPVPVAQSVPVQTVPADPMAPRVVKPTSSYTAQAQAKSPAAVQPLRTNSYSQAMPAKTTTITPSAHSVVAASPPVAQLPRTPSYTPPVLTAGPAIGQPMSVVTSRASVQTTRAPSYTPPPQIVQAAGSAIAQQPRTLSYTPPPQSVPVVVSAGSAVSQQPRTISYTPPPQSVPVAVQRPSYTPAPQSVQAAVPVVVQSRTPSYVPPPQSVHTSGPVASPMLVPRQPSYTPAPQTVYTAAAPTTMYGAPPMVVQQPAAPIQPVPQMQRPSYTPPPQAVAPQQVSRPSWTPVAMPSHPSYTPPPGAMGGAAPTMTALAPATPMTMPSVLNGIAMPRSPSYVPPGVPNAMTAPGSLPAVMSPAPPNSRLMSSAFQDESQQRRPVDNLMMTMQMPPSNGWQGPPQSPMPQWTPPPEMQNAAAPPFKGIPMQTMQAPPPQMQQAPPPQMQQAPPHQMQNIPMQTIQAPPPQMQNIPMQTIQAPPPSMMPNSQAQHFERPQTYIAPERPQTAMYPSSIADINSMPQERPQTQHFLPEQQLVDTVMQLNPDPFPNPFQQFQDMQSKSDVGGFNQLGQTLPVVPAWST